MLAGAAILLAAANASAQAVPHYDLARLSGVTFAEQVRSDIVTQSGMSERRRIVSRTAQYTVAVRADTVVVTADTASLTQDADGTQQAVDVDAIIGARWTLLLDAAGRTEVIDVPVVPAGVADVSDIGRAMDDFFPATPPRLGVGASSSDARGNKWRRLPDSGGVARYHLTGSHRATNQVTGASLAVVSDEDVTEISDIAWDTVRGPEAWTRSLVIIETSHFAGRTVRAQVEQHINVRQIHPH